MPIAIFAIECCEAREDQRERERERERERATEQKERRKILA